MVFDRGKFAALVLYICWRCKADPSKLGAVKLNKILWLSDFVSYYSSGAPITGVRYIKRQYGPVPGAIVPVLRELEAKHLIEQHSVNFHGRTKKEFSVFREPELGMFQQDELNIVDRMIETVCETHTAKSISEASHDHVWQAAEDGEEIPYFTIFARPGAITDDEREWALLELAGLEAA